LPPAFLLPLEQPVWQLLLEEQVRRAWQVELARVSLLPEEQPVWRQQPFPLLLPWEQPLQRGVSSYAQPSGWSVSGRPRPR
jgi:hypothetical protein